MRKILLFIITISYSSLHAQINCTNWLRTPSRQSYVDIGQLNVTGNNITIEAEINRTAPYVDGGGDGSEGDVVSKHDNPNDINYLLRPNHGFITTTNGFFTTPDISDVELNKTYHIAMVYDGSTLKFYRNGCLMSEVPASGNLFQNTWDARIGYYQNQTWNTNFIGYINEVRIWNVARTQAQIRAYMNSSLPNPASQSGLLAYYTFDNLINKQGNSSWNGTISGSASINQTNSSCNSIQDLCAPVSTDSIIINDYTGVLNLDICNNELTVENASKYKVGDTVLIIQMKGAVIDSTNTVDFGTVKNYKNAGNYEFNIIKQKNGNQLSLLNNLERQYSIPDGKVQLVRVPYYQNMDIRSTLTCLPWDGTKGGILAFNVKGNINMYADIDVSGKGFRHGNPLNSTLVTLNEQGYYYPPSTNEGAQKGESIYNISTEINYGRGAPSNGGGGGNGHNSGGGGGGNGGIGGQGGDQWETGKTITENVGGKGGKPLSNSAVLNKLYLGGSGGMGQANDLREYPAGNGGGIIIISGSVLTSNLFMIKSNGMDATEAPSSIECKDGMGGGGAGGSILLNINSVTGSATIKATGGKGADHIAQNVLHGPGGGGGGGMIAVSQAIIPPQYNVILSGGINGVNVYHANNPWGATPGGTGIVLNNFTPLIDKSIFKKNIDSIRIYDSNYNCTTFDFKGLAYTQVSPINHWVWNFSNANTASVQNVTYTFPTKGSNNVKLTASDINGCKDSISIVLPIKVITVGKSPDTILCGSSAVKIFATGGTFYSWFPATGLDNAKSSTPLATPLLSTKYYVTVTNEEGCSKNDSVSIIVNKYPTISKSNDTSICKNSQAFLLANGGSTYSWSPATSLNNSGIANPLATPDSSTTYVVKVTNSFGCSKLDSIFVAVKPVTIITKSNDTTICRNASARIFATGGNSYAWTPSSSLDNSTNATPLASPSATTVYHVTITDSLSCIYNDSVKISVRAPAVFSVSPDQAVCVKTPQQLTASGGDVYFWSPTTFLDHSNISNPIATPDSSVTYSVTIKANACNESETLSTKLVVLPIPVLHVAKSNDITCFLPSSHLNVTGAENYTWSPSIALNSSTIADPVATPSVTTFYTVFGKDLHGCTNSDTVTVKVAFNGNAFYGLPNSFSPNDDGLNDCFGIKYWGVVDQLDFSIYNRFGQRVFYSTNSANCWDGTFKGALQAADIYVYIIKAKTVCGNIYRKGTVMLLR